MKRFLSLIFAFLLLFSPVTYAIQNPIVVNDGSGYQVRTGFNNALQSLVTLFARTSVPNPLYPYQIWIKTTNGQVMQANAKVTGSDVLGVLNSDGTIERDLGIGSGTAGIAHGGTGATALTGALINLGTVSSSTLAATDTGNGADDVGFAQPYTGAVPQTVQSKLQDFISVKDFGAIGDGVTDDTAAIQYAINYAENNNLGKEIYFPSGVYKCTSTLNITAGISLRGDTPKSKNVGGSAIGGGTWLYFAHAGKGISAQNSSGYYTDVYFRNIGTYRNQPNPVPGYTPNNNDYDFYIYGISDITFEDVLLLNPTKGIGIFGNPLNGSGRLNLYKVRGQFLTKGIVIDTAYDVCRIDQFHCWPFWKDDYNIETWTLNNLDAIQLLRCDNPLLSNIFTIFARTGLRISQNADGTTAKIHLANADFDRGCLGIWVDDTVTSGVTGQFTNVTHQGESGFAGSKALYIQGNNNNFDIANFRTDYTSQNGVRIEGKNNTVRFANLTINNYDQTDGNFPAIEALTGNTVYITPKPIIGSGGGKGGTYAPKGTYNVDEWRSFTPVVSSQTGTITKLGTVSGKFKVVGNTVYVEATINITTNGTAAGDVRINLPYSTPSANSIGIGREIAVTGKSLTVTILNANSQANILNYDNTYPGSNGCSLNVMFSYTI